MLGSEILSKFSEEKNVEILPCYRSLLEVDNYGRYKARFQKLVSDYRPDYVINCVVINHRRRTISGVMQQMVVNGIFPRYVAKQFTSISWSKSRQMVYFLERKVGMLSRVADIREIYIAYQRLSVK